MRNKSFITAIVLVGTIAFSSSATRTIVTLKDGWRFKRGDAARKGEWQEVRIPHDWAIYGPFDVTNDLQEVAVEQNGETKKTLKTGRTGGLPFIGKGAYRRTLEIGDTAQRQHTLIFDGAMSNARVRLNGREVVFQPYGYNSFYVDLDNDMVHPGENDLQVELENFEKASRWYPGAGLYRNVHLLSAPRVHIPVWGTYITTPVITSDYASVSVEMEIAGAVRDEKINVVTEIISPDGETVARDSAVYVSRDQSFRQNLLVDSPLLWSPETPCLYTMRTTLKPQRGGEEDVYTTRFGIRDIKYVPEKGFFLNGKVTKFRGVCNHHDLGPLGAAVNRSALRHQIEMLKDMGVNAIRTSHNMPAPELVELCDEMGVMLMIEPFDDWGYRPKSPNGYGAVFKEWATRDIGSMVRHYRNSPSVVMWSIGNEVPSQSAPEGMEELVMLRDEVRSLDPTRPITCGMDRIGTVLDNGFAAALDIPGFNYKPQYYDDAYSRLPQKLILGSETASTVSSRGVYHFPVNFAEHNVVIHDDNQSSGYDNETCSWSNTPDIDFAMDEDREWVIGQFVWTGFDYLGEPSPYDTDAWPSHSSLFGIIDLASLPKDRFYLYRSVWNKDASTLHILPHWNWEGREGEVTPVHVYTSYPKAELFLNGKSLGVREKNDSTVYNRYRLMWDDVVYHPGELKVVAYNDSGSVAEEKRVRTSGKAYGLKLSTDRESLKADGDDLAYFTVQVVDMDGNIVPVDTRKVRFSVEGAGRFEATANGDPTCLMSFREPEMKLFSGAATVIVRSAETPGNVRLKVSAPGVKSAEYTLPVIKEKF